MEKKPKLSAVIELLYNLIAFCVLFAADIMLGIRTKEFYVINDLLAAGLVSSTFSAINIPIQIQFTSFFFKI